MNRLLEEVQQNENERKQIIQNETNQQSSQPPSNNTIPSQMNPNDILDFDVNPVSGNQPVQNFMNTNGAEISRIEQGHDDLSRNISNLDILGVTDNQQVREPVPNKILDNSTPQTNADANVNLVTAASGQEMGEPSPPPAKEMPNFDDLDFDDLSTPANPKPENQTPNPPQETQPQNEQETQPQPQPTEPQAPEPLDQTPAPPKSPQPAVSTGFDDIFDAPPPPAKQSPQPQDSQKSLERKRSERLDEDDANMYADTEGYDDEPGGYFNQNLYHNDDDDDYFSGNEGDYDSYKRGDTQKSGHQGSKVQKKPEQNDDFL